MKVKFKRPFFYEGNLYPADTLLDLNIDEAKLPSTAEVLDKKEVAKIKEAEDVPVQTSPVKAKTDLADHVEANVGNTKPDKPEPAKTEMKK